MFKFILIFMSLFILASCGDDAIVIDETLPVTTHFAIEDSLGDGEWQYFVTITVNSDNIVTDVNLNGVTRLANTSRREVAQLDDYEELFGYNFYQQASSLERSLIGISSDELVDAILDAYNNDIVDFDTTAFASLANLALASAPVERGLHYIDGIYHSINAINDDDFQYFVNLFIINGDIVAAHFNAINDEGLLKYDQFTDTTVDDEIIAWRYQAQLLEQALIRLQDPMEFTFDDDGLTDDIPGVDIEIESFVSLVIQALSAGPIVTEIAE